MVLYCIVPECRSTTEDPNCAVSFYMIPRDPELAQQWASNVFPDQNARLSSTVRVCSLHFVESDFKFSVKGMRFLKEDAVPTVFGPAIYTKSRKSLRARKRYNKNCVSCTNCTSPCHSRKRHVKNSISTLPEEKKSVDMPAKDSDLPSTPQRHVKNSISTSPEEEKSVDTPAKDSDLSSASQADSHGTSSPAEGRDGCRKHIIIVRGSEMYAAVAEREPCNKPSSDEKSHSLEGTDGVWKTKHIVRLKNIDSTKLLIRNVDFFAKVEEGNKLGELPCMIPSLPKEPTPCKDSAVVPKITGVTPAAAQSPKELVRNVELSAKLNEANNLLKSSCKIPALPKEHTPCKETGVVSETRRGVPVASQSPKALIRNAGLSVKVEEEKLIAPPHKIRALPKAPPPCKETPVVLKRIEVIPVASQSPMALTRNASLSAKVEEEKLIKAPCKIPASPKKPPPCKETPVVSKRREVSPVASKTQKPCFICNDCKKENKVVVLKPFEFIHHFTIFLCPSEGCIYPLSEKDLYRFVYKRSPGKPLQPCSRREAPTVKNIITVLSSSSTQERKYSAGAS